MPFGTGAGKGPLPRHVDGDKFRSNYERIFGKKKPTHPQEEEKTEKVVAGENTKTKEADDLHRD